MAKGDYYLSFQALEAENESLRAQLKSLKQELFRTKSAAGEAKSTLFNALNIDTRINLRSEAQRAIEKLETIWK